MGDKAKYTNQLPNTHGNKNQIGFKNTWEQQIYTVGKRMGTETRYQWQTHGNRNQKELEVLPLTTCTTEHSLPPDVYQGGIYYHEHKVSM